MARHEWIEDDDIALLIAIDECKALREHYSRQGYAQGPWWDAVAGRLCSLREGQIVVTGSACRARFARLDAVGPEEGWETTTFDGWERAAEIVAAWERTATDDLGLGLERAAEIAHDLGEHHVLALLQAALVLLRAREKA